MKMHIEDPYNKTRTLCGKRAGVLTRKNDTEEMDGALCYITYMADKMDLSKEEFLERFKNMYCPKCWDAKYPKEEVMIKAMGGYI